MTHNVAVRALTWEEVKPLSQLLMCTLCKVKVHQAMESKPLSNLWQIFQAFLWNRREQGEVAGRENLNTHCCVVNVVLQQYMGTYSYEDFMHVAKERLSVKA